MEFDEKLNRKDNVEEEKGMTLEDLEAEADSKRLYLEMESKVL
jgi:hypothetical protein